MELEAVRILARKRGDRGATEINQDALDRLRGDLKKFGVAEVANELILASLLAKAQRLAYGSVSGIAVTERKEQVNA